MANSYTHFTVALPLNAEQGEEAKALLETFELWVEAKVNEDEFDEEVTPADMALFERIYNADFEDWTGLSIIVEDDGAVFLSDDAGSPNVDLAGEFASALLDRFDIDTPIGMEWGCTSDRPTPTAFGGGAAVIRRDGIEWMNTFGWLKERIPGYGEEPTPEATPSP